MVNFVEFFILNRLNSLMELFGFKCTLNMIIFINYNLFLEVIDMQNLRCKIHPSEIISNFCTRGIPLIYLD